MLINFLIIIAVATLFRGWILHQLHRQAWNSGGLSRKTLLILNTFALTTALVSAVGLAGTKEKNAVLIGMICILVFWFISFFISKILRSLSQ